MFWAVPDTCSCSFWDTSVAPFCGSVMVPVGAAVADGVDAAAVDGEDVTRADAGDASAGAGVSVEVCAAGFASPASTMAKAPATAPPTITRMPPATAICTPAFCALYQRPNPIFSLQAYRA